MHRLLFIEDDDQIRLALRLALEDEGYVVEEAADGRSGLAAFDRGEPDLVIVDLRLPDIQGFDVCRTIRAKSIVPIMIVTAQTDTYDLVAGLEAGADDYVTKPVVPKELAARIRALLRRVQLHETTAPKATQFGDLELRDRVEKAIARLPANYRLLVAAHYLRGIQYEELAEALQLPLGTVKTQLYRAKQQLRRLLETELR